MTEPKERPIIFSSPMVRAILDGRKNMTRRVVKKPEDAHSLDYVDDYVAGFACGSGRNGTFIDWTEEVRCPFGKPGDRLWVRERWWHFKTPELEMSGFRGGTVALLGDNQTHYHPNEEFSPENYPKLWTKKNAMFMPRWASRITLEVTDIRAERLQDITEADARREGFESVADFREGWNTIHNSKKHPERQWDANLWCWVVGFKRVVQ